MKASKSVSRRSFLKSAAATGAAASVGALSTAGTAWAQTPRPIKIGAPMPLTGRFTRAALYSVEGYRLWAKHINEMGYSFGNEHLPDRKPGLVGGRKVEVSILDDASDPTAGARLMTHLVHSEKVDLVFGAYASSITMSTKPIIEAAGIPCVAPLASSQDIWLNQKLQWMVQVMAPSRDRFAGLEPLCKQAGFNKVAVIYIDDAMPIAAATGLRKRLQDGGFNTVLYEAYPIGIKDMVSIVRKARDAGADVLAGGGYLEDGILMAKAALSLKWAPKAIWQMGDFVLPDFRKSLGDNAAWQVGDTEWLPDAPWPGNKEFVDAYRKEYKREPEWLAAAAYGGCQLLEEAVKKTGGVENRRAIRDLLFSMERDTVFGHYKVNPLGHADAGLQVKATRLGVQYQMDKGNLVTHVVYPTTAATGKFVTPFRWEKA